MELYGAVNLETYLYVKIKLQLLVNRFIELYKYLVSLFVLLSSLGLYYWFLSIDSLYTHRLHEIKQ
jgi:hypothetical protein